MSMRVATKAIRTGAKIVGGGTLAFSAGSAAATFYVYKTDKSYQRLIDFHLSLAPMCWDYYKFYKFDSNDGEGDGLLERLHEKYAEESLGHILRLGGYYVKCAQMFCGMGLLPAAYEREYSILLDGVPPKPYDVVEGIVLEELGGESVRDHFESFDAVPIAAASIGQVHCARIRKQPADGGKGKSSSPSTLDVVVKVQYPEVEEFFRMDVLGMKNLCLLCARSGIDIGVDEKSLDDIFHEITKSFEEEFDYRREADNMELVHDNMMEEPRFAPRVKVPLPIKEKTTKKVLTMERIRGVPIKQRMEQIMDQYASRAGKTRAELEEELQGKLEDPIELERLLSQKPPSKAELFFYCTWMRTTDLVANGKIWLRKTFFLRNSENSETYKRSVPPLDAADISSLLYSVHAHQVFVNGAFNADPHAGNILLCEDERGGTKLGLVDFGNVQRIPDPKRRVDLARFYLSMADDFSQDPKTWNDEEIARRFAAIGGASVRSDAPFLAANALMMYDVRYDPETLARYGIAPDMSNAAEALYGRDEFQEFPADLVNLQRLSQTLLGVAGAIGAGQPSCARMWRRQCRALVSECS